MDNLIVDYMAYFIIAVATLSGLYFHWWIYARIKRWANRDLALSMAGKDEKKQRYMLEKLSEAQSLKISKDDLEAWLSQASDSYTA